MNSMKKDSLCFSREKKGFGNQRFANYYTGLVACHENSFSKTLPITTGMADIICTCTNTNRLSCVYM